jgi:golgi to ER traffic protein 4
LFLVVRGLNPYRWSAKQGPYPAGDSALQHYIGDLLLKGTRRITHVIQTHTLVSPECDFVGAEPHLLASGTRDSARLLAQLYFDWARASDSLGSHAGIFSLRGVLPYVLRPHIFQLRVPFSSNRYLLNGNVLAARAFLATFISHISPPGETVVIGSTSDEIILTRDSLLNFAQLAVRCVQRAAGAQNKTAREAWVRLCRTYQSRGGILAQPQVREVCQTDFFFSHPLAGLNI